MVLLSAQGMPAAKIAEVAFTSADRARDVIHNFNADGFDSLCPKYKGGRPRTFTRCGEKLSSTPNREPRPRRRATYARPHGVRHLKWRRAVNWALASTIVRAHQHAGAVVEFAEQGRPTATTSRVSASMTTWWLVEYP